MSGPERPGRGDGDGPPEDGSPKFGRLLIVLFLAVMFIIALTFAAASYYS
jgi:hypothetical protein